MTYAKKEVHQLVFEHILNSLRVKNEKLNATTLDLCEAIGPPLQRHLVAELADRQRSAIPSHRVRLMHAIARTGRITDPDLWLDLSVLLGYERHPKVRAAADQLYHDMLHLQNVYCHMAAVPEETRSVVRALLDSGRCASSARTAIS